MPYIDLPSAPGWNRTNDPRFRKPTNHAKKHKAVRIHAGLKPYDLSVSTIVNEKKQGGLKYREIR